MHLLKKKAWKIYICLLHQFNSLHFIITNPRFGGVSFLPTSNVSWRIINMIKFHLLYKLNWCRRTYYNEVNLSPNGFHNSNGCYPVVEIKELEPVQFSVCQKIQSAPNSLKIHSYNSQSLHILSKNAAKQAYNLKLSPSNQAREVKTHWYNYTNKSKNALILIIIIYNFNSKTSLKIM